VLAEVRLACELAASLTTPVAVNVFAIWSSNSKRLVTTTHIRLPAALPGTFQWPAPFHSGFLGRVNSGR
jgi:hypothetical protein